MSKKMRKKQAKWVYEFCLWQYNNLTESEKTVNPTPPPPPPDDPDK